MEVGKSVFHTTVHSTTSSVVSFNVISSSEVRNLLDIYNDSWLSLHSAASHFLQGALRLLHALTVDRVSGGLGGEEERLGGEDGGLGGEDGGDKTKGSDASDFGDIDKRLLAAHDHLYHIYHQALSSLKEEVEKLWTSDKPLIYQVAHSFLLSYSRLHSNLHSQAKQVFDSIWNGDACEVKEQQKGATTTSTSSTSASSSTTTSGGLLNKASIFFSKIGSSSGGGVSAKASSGSTSHFYVQSSDENVNAKDNIQADKSDEMPSTKICSDFNAIPQITGEDFDEPDVDDLIEFLSRTRPKKHHHPLSLSTSSVVSDSYISQPPPPPLRGSFNSFRGRDGSYTHMGGRKSISRHQPVQMRFESRPPLNQYSRNHILQPGQQHMQPGQQHMQPGQQHMQPGQQHMQPGQQHMQPGQQHMQPGQQHMQPGQQHMQPSQQHMQPNKQQDPQQPFVTVRHREPSSAQSRSPQHLWHNMNRLQQQQWQLRQQRHLVGQLEPQLPPIDSGRAEQWMTREHRRGVSATLPVTSHQENNVGGRLLMDARNTWPTTPTVIPAADSMQQLLEEQRQQLFSDDFSFTDFPASAFSSIYPSVFSSADTQSLFSSSSASSTPAPDNTFGWPTNSSLLSGDVTVARNDSSMSGGSLSQESHNVREVVRRRYSSSEETGNGKKPTSRDSKITSDDMIMTNALQGMNLTDWSPTEDTTDVFITSSHPGGFPPSEYEDNQRQAGIWDATYSMFSFRNTSFDP